MGLGDGEGDGRDRPRGGALFLNMAVRKHRDVG